MLATNKTPSRYPAWLIDLAWLTIVFLGFYTFWLGHYPLFTPDEGRYTEAAREMLVSSDFITPRVNGIAFLDKPILYYWLQALAMRWFGINEWAIRFFPALLGVFGCLYTYVCGRTLFNRRTGLLSAVILALTPLYFGGAHYADLNMEVAVFISCTLLSFITGSQSTGWRRHAFLLSAYLFAALAFLTKGLIGIAFPAMIGGLWIALLMRWSLLKNIHLITGLALFTALVLPWYILVQKANPAFLHYFFVTQQVSRFLSAGTFNNPSPIWFYLPVIAAGFLPWTILLIPALRQTITTVWQTFRANPVLLYLLLWPAVITLFFSIPTAKTIGYIFPVFPPLALLTGYYLDKTWNKNKIAALFSGIISTMILLSALIAAPHFNQKTTKPFAIELNKIIKPDDEVVNYFKFYQDLPIYLNRPVTLVADWESPDIEKHDNWMRELWYGKIFQDTSDSLINEKTFWQKWHGQKRLFVFVSKNNFAKFKAQAKYYFYLDSNNNVMLVSNEPTLYGARWIRN